MGIGLANFFSEILLFYRKYDRIELIQPNNCISGSGKIRRVMKKAEDLLDISKEHYNRTPSMMKKLEVILEEAEKAAYNGKLECYISLSEYDDDYAKVKRYLKDLGYSIYTGKAYQEYITWKK